MHVLCASSGFDPKSGEITQTATSGVVKCINERGDAFCAFFNLSGPVHPMFGGIGDAFGLARDGFGVFIVVLYVCMCVM